MFGKINKRIKHLEEALGELKDVDFGFFLPAKEKRSVRLEIMKENFEKLSSRLLSLEKFLNIEWTHIEEGWKYKRCKRPNKAKEVVNGR